MSEFSDLLSLLIKNQDVNVSALTAYCELDRSTMYKLINGKRAPSSKALVQKLASFMNLNPLETQELLQAYLLTKVGWDTYYSRKMYWNLSSVSQICIVNPFRILLHLILTLPPGIPKKTLLPYQDRFRLIPVSIRWSLNFFLNLTAIFSFWLSQSTWK